MNALPRPSMKFQTDLDETIFVSEVTPEQDYMFDKELKTGLSVLWNREATATIMINHKMVTLNKNCAIFLTEYHEIDSIHFKRMNVIQFNRPFYCVRDNDDETGCKGLLFYTGSFIPKISIPEEKLRPFELVWEFFMMEMQEKDSLKLEMLRVLLKRFLILFIRIYKEQNTNVYADDTNMLLVREYHFLVEQHFKQHSNVAYYADLLHRSPKTLSNIFSKLIGRSPLQIINDRRLLEAKKLLKSNDLTIQEISEELGFGDGPSFSHFFRSRVGNSPSGFRQTIQAKKLEE